MTNKKDKEIYFLSKNKYKLKEVKEILNLKNYEICLNEEKIEEIQSKDMIKIVEDKLLKAFKKISRPLIVEQTGLILEDLGGFPGGLTQIFWDSLQADKFTQYFSTKTGTGKAKAKTVVGYCDGKQIKIFEGEVNGIIVEEPRENRSFQWDCVFQPEGYTTTFAEMEEKKNQISMRKIALEQLRNYLEG